MAMFCLNINDTNSAKLFISLNVPADQTTVLIHYRSTLDIQCKHMVSHFHININ